MKDSVGAESQHKFFLEHEGFEGEPKSAFSLIKQSNYGIILGNEANYTRPSATLLPQVAQHLFKLFFCYFAFRIPLSDN